MRSIKSTYFASFVLGAVIALIAAASARSAELFRLDRITIVQYAAAPDGLLLRRNGVLAVDGRITWRGTQSLSRPANFRNETLDRPFVHVEAWAAYHNLGYGAVAGFVIEERPRTVLIRAVGPTLARFGIGSFIANPALTVQHNGQTLLANDDWPASPDKDDVRRAAAHVAAFPLEEGSRDAASLAILAPGAYTVLVESADSSRPAGDVLVEIYPVPDTFFLSAAS